MVRDEYPGFATVGSPLNKFEGSMFVKKELINPAIPNVAHSVLYVVTNPVSEDRIRVK
jgi:hypothetical protein